MTTFAFIKVALLVYLFMWAISILYENFRLERSRFEHRKFLKLQKICGRINAKRRLQNMAILRLGKKNPKECLAEPINPRLRGWEPKSHEYEAWKVRYYMDEDDDSVTFPRSNSPLP